MTCKPQTVAKIGAFVIALCACAFGQQRYVQPDPNSGRPLLVLSMDGMRWEVPILVYSDSDADQFVSPDSLIISTHSFDHDGKFYVYLYTWYKNDYPCKKMFTPAQKAKSPNFANVCKFLGYKLRWLDVDTRGNLARVPMLFLVDTDGNMDTPIKGSQQWSSTAKFPKDDWLRVTINNISDRLRNEIRKEKLKGQF